MALSFLLIGRHFGPAWTDYILHGPGLRQLGSYVLVTALACIGYGAVFLMCGLFFKNPMIPAAVVWVWENINPFLPGRAEEDQRDLLPEESLPGGSAGARPASILALEADPVPAWLAVPGLVIVSALVLYVAGRRARPLPDQLQRLTAGASLVKTCTSPPIGLPSAHSLP